MNKTIERNSVNSLYFEGEETRIYITVQPNGNVFINILNPTNPHKVTPHVTVQVDDNVKVQR